MKEYAKGFVFIAAMIAMLVPLFVWFTNPELTQMQIFFNTWMWILYSFIIYIIGISIIKEIWKN